MKQTTYQVVTSDDQNLREDTALFEHESEARAYAHRTGSRRVRRLRAEGRSRVFDLLCSGKGRQSALRGGRPRTEKIYKTFGESCPASVMTHLRGERGGYAVTPEGGKGLVRKDNNVTVFSKDATWSIPARPGRRECVEGARQAIANDK